MSCKCSNPEYYQAPNTIEVYCRVCNTKDVTISYFVQRSFEWGKRIGEESMRDKIKDILHIRG